MASILAIGIGATQFMRGADAAGAILYHPTATCSDSQADVTFNWLPLAGATSQTLQVSLLDNGFGAGTYTSVKLDQGQTTYTMAALDSSIPNYWRIVSVNANGEVASETKVFVPCGAPFLLWGPMECRGWDSAAVRFNWAPVAGDAGQQWIEFDTEGDWAGDDFWRAGPFSSSTSTARRSDFLDGVGYTFRIVQEIDGQTAVSTNGWFMPDCKPDVNPLPYPTDDRLVIPAIGVNAAILNLDVGFDGTLGVPDNGYDVVRYDFRFFPSMAGTVGGSGPKLIGGHLDYHVIGRAVFWDISRLKAGDVLEYWDGGVLYKYVVDWTTSVPYDQTLNPYIEASTGDTLMLVTCFGVFDRDEFGGYNARTLVHAVRQ